MYGFRSVQQWFKWCYPIRAWRTFETSHELMGLYKRDYLCYLRLFEIFFLEKYLFKSYVSYDIDNH